MAEVRRKKTSVNWSKLHCIRLAREKRKPNIDDYFGIWSDEEYMDADELVKEIHDARCFNPKRDEFLERFFTEP